jgi:hypothetical protein
MGGRFCVMRFARVGHVTFAEKNVPGILNLNGRLISVELAAAGKRSSGDMSQGWGGRSLRREVAVRACSLWWARYGFLRRSSLLCYSARLFGRSQES